MSGNNYDDALEISYTFTSDFVGGAAVDGRIIGPAGKTGRVRSITTVLTTGVTVAASSVEVDTAAGVAVPAALTVPIAAVNSGHSATKAAIEASSELPADTVVQVNNGGGSTAGVGETTVVIGWY